MSHKGPYTITFVHRESGRTTAHVRKTFKAAENVASTWFLRERLISAQISNSQGAVHSVYNFQRKDIAIESEIEA